MTPIRSEQVFAALAAAGIVSNHDQITRVVIDLQVRQMAVIHVRRYGDARLLDVVQTLEGVEIRDGSEVTQ